jgi:hypothetical protein
MSTGASAPVYQSTLTQVNGNIIITSNTAATSTTTGALQIVNGGLGVAGGGFFGGIVTATTFVGTFNGTIGAGTTITTATNIAAGTAGQLHYQSAPGITAFAGPGTAGQLLVSAGTSAPTYTNTGSIGVGFVSNLLTAGTGLTGTAYNGSVAQTWTLNTATLVATAVTALTVSGTVTTATNIAAGTAGQLPYQSAPSVTGFAGPGTFGQFLMSTGANAPVYQSTLTQAGGNIIITSNTAATSTTTGALQVVNGGVGIGGNLYVGGEIVATKLTIQLTTVTTTLVQTDDIISTYNYTNATSTTTGALQVAGGAGIGRDLYVGGNITVLGTINASITGVSTTATNIAGGTAGQLHYQTGPGATSFVSTATTGNFLQANYVGAPTWTTTASMYVGAATSAVNLFGGSAGQFAYQTAAGATAFVSTGSMYVNRATLADSATAVAAGGISGTIGNSQLTGSGAVTVTAGTGVSGGGSVALGSTITINAVGTTINSTSSAYVLVAGDAGKTISITTGGVTIPNAVMSAGNIVSIYNNSGSSQTITQGSSLTLQWAGQSTSQTGNRTLGLYGMCTILFITASSAVITGSGLT